MLAQHPGTRTGLLFAGGGLLAALQFLRLSLHAESALRVCKVRAPCPETAGLQPARATAEKGCFQWRAAAAALAAKRHSMQEHVLQHVSQVGIVAHASCLLAFTAADKELYLSVPSWLTCCVFSQWSEHSTCARQGQKRRPVWKGFCGPGLRCGPIWQWLRLFPAELSADVVAAVGFLAACAKSDSLYGLSALWHTRACSGADTR